MKQLSKPVAALEVKWRREGTDWVLHLRRRRMGRVVPDAEYPGMWRSVKSRCQLSDMASLSWAKDAALKAAIREMEWNVAQDAATDPSKCPVNRGVNRPEASYVRLNPPPLSLGLPH
jgi:hypothetical protein